MSTPYQDIYDRFAIKIDDYQLSSLPDDTFDNTLLKYLKGAIFEFKYCIQDLSDRDDTNSLFNVDLTEEEQEILAKFMVCKWLDGLINHLDNLKQKFGNKDFQIFSSSNHLKELRETYNLRYQESVNDMNFYYYSN